MHAYISSISSRTSQRPQPSNQNRSTGLERTGGALVAMGSVRISQHPVWAVKIKRQLMRDQIANPLI